MFDFIRKPLLWELWDRHLDQEIGKTRSFHLKSIQDLVVYSYLRGLSGKSIAEVGGGNSRLLAVLAERNRCFNVDRFDGSHGGPNEEISIPGVQNVKAYLGEFSDQLAPDSLDAVFSVSVVEHVPNLEPFLSDGLRVLRSGGIWLHAIDLYIEDAPDDVRRSRFEAYRAWFDAPDLLPVGTIYRGPMKFSCDLATNPDNTMYSWGKVAPALISLRQRAQSVSLIVAGQKR